MDILTQKVEQEQGKVPLSLVPSEKWGVMLEQICEVGPLSLLYHLMDILTQGRTSKVPLTLSLFRRWEFMHGQVCEAGMC